MAKRLMARRFSRGAATAVLTVAAGAAMSGCAFFNNADSGVSEPAAMGETVAQRIGERDAEGICDIAAVSGRPVNNTPGIGKICTSTVESMLDRLSQEQLDAAAEAEVEVVSEDENSAVVQISGIDQDIPLVKIDGSWYFEPI